MKKKSLAVVALIFVVLVLVVSSVVTAGLVDWFNRVTGRAIDTVTINITVGTPVVITVFNNSFPEVSGGLNAGPSSTTVVMNFSVNSPAGADNIDFGSATMNFTKQGESVRTNVSCSRVDLNGNFMNFSCGVEMLWFDATGAWVVSAYIADNQSNSNLNNSANLSVGESTGFELGPSAITFTSISAGATNTTSNNDPIFLNNTGNAEFGLTTGNISINATSLRGETDATLALWAGNFTVNVATGGDPPAECTGNFLQDNSTFVDITGATLPNGNYSIADGTTGAEQLYICLTLAGSDLSTQSYSTSNESNWQIQIA
jgi:hypothetical protein